MRYISIMAMGAVLASGAWASGFRLNEQSLNATALSSAYIAGAMGADSSYYNPANMGFDDNNELEVNATMIFIPGFDFTTAGRDKGVTMNGMPFVPAGAAVVNGYANSTYAFVPKMFFKTKALQVNETLKSSFGISLTTPSGLTMNWGGEGGEFMDNVGIAMVEINPVMALTFNDRFSIGGGMRFIYSSGEFNNTLYVPYNVPNLSSGTTKVTQTSETSAVGVGYNLAATLKMTEKTTFAITYRSKVHFDMKGKLSALANMGGQIGTANMDADLNLSTDLPDTINVGLAHRFSNLLAEFTYEHTFWSKADIFEFGYSNQKFSNLTGMLQALGEGYVQNMMNAADYSAVAMGRGWKNSNAFRLGFTYLSSPKLTLMGSLALDLTPVPQGKDRFGIPDANAYMLGLGARYALWDNRADVGIAYSLSLKDNRNSFIQSKDGLGQLHLLTIGAKYRF